MKVLKLTKAHIGNRIRCRTVNGEMVDGKLVGIKGQDIKIKADGHKFDASLGRLMAGYITLSLNQLKRLEKGIEIHAADGGDLNWWGKFKGVNRKVLRMLAPDGSQMSEDLRGDETIEASFVFPTRWQFQRELSRGESLQVRI